MSQCYICLMLFSITFIYKMSQCYIYIIVIFIGKNVTIAHKIYIW